MTLINDIIDNIRHNAEDGRVVLGVSGGVDSTVLAILLNKAVGKKLHCLFLDSGLNRRGEKEKVTGFLHSKNIKVNTVNIKKQLLKDFRGKIAASDKKQAIKRIFNRTFYIYSRKIGAKFIAHGTNKDDSELLFKRRNRLIDNPGIKNLEPFLKIRKNRIKELAKVLKIPNEIRQKFPLSAWGFSRKIVGEVTPERLEIITKVDDIYLSLLKKYHYYHKLRTAAAYLYPYFNKELKNSYFIILKAVDKNNQSARLSPEFLGRVSEKITQAIPKVNRVVYDLSNGANLGREWE